MVGGGGGPPLPPSCFYCLLSRWKYLTEQNHLQSSPTLDGSVFVAPYPAQPSPGHLTTLNQPGVVAGATTVAIGGVKVDH